MNNMRFVAGALVSLGMVGCASVGEAPVSAERDTRSQWTNEELTAAGLLAIERKREKLATRGPKSFDAPQEAQDFFLAQRVAPGQAYPVQQLRDELNAIIARETQESAATGEDAWTWLGPGNIGGRTRALTIDSTNPDTMYAGGVAGGIWKTIDGGASWNVADDMMLNLAIADIAMDPNDPNVLYAGTGEGVLLGDPGLRGLGIFKSSDAGATWTQLPATVGSAFYYVNKVRVSANDSNRVYAATRTGVWRSLDAGQTWSVVLRNPNSLGGDAQASNGCQVGCTELQIRPLFVLGLWGPCL